MSTLLNDVYIVLLMSFLAILLGIVCAFYLEEWLPKTNWIRRLIESLLSVLTGIPSLLYGIVAIRIFFTDAGALKAIRIFPIPQNAAAAPLHDDSMLLYAGAATFIVMVMPVTIKTTQDALRSVGTPIREVTYALGASQWQVLTRQVVPLALKQILAGGCRAMSRAFATTALLLGIYTWHYTSEPKEMSNRFILFLGMALFLSILSSTLTEMDNSSN